MDYVIRPLTNTDEPILWDMLYQALHTSEGAPPRDAVKRPEFARYVEGWGRPHDTGFAAHDKASGELLGAVWIRRLSDQTDPPSELAFGVKTDLRRRGIGAALLTQLVKTHPEQSTISIRASANNPAVRLYERFGFKIVKEGERSVTMRREAWEIAILPVPIAKQIIEEPTLEAFCAKGYGAPRGPLVSVGYAPQQRAWSSAKDFQIN